MDVYEIKSSPNFGRYLIAKKDIPARTLILSEFPLIYAPADDRDHELEKTDPEKVHENEDETLLASLEQCQSLLFCLGCCTQLEKEDFVRCTDCGWPLCSKLCKSETIHKENECRIFRKNESTFPPPNMWPVLYKSILVLRIVILVKERLPSIWTEFFTQLEHHNDVRQNKDHCKRSDRMIFENMKYFLKSSYFELDEGFLQTIVGVINVNAFCANKTDKSSSKNGRKAKCLFQKASLFAHSCAPNCSWKIDVLTSPEIRVYSSIAIKKGDLICIPYNTRHLFYGTLKRQLLIESVAHFVCKCSRCQDSTEMGTYMSSVKCFACEKGYLCSEDPSNSDSLWVCSDKTCLKAQNVGKVVYFVTKIEDQLDRIQSAELSWKEEVDRLQKLFVKHSDVSLHPNHYTLQEIATRILELFVSELEQGSREDIEMFLWHCKYLLSIADVILPGFNGYREQLLDYEAEGKFYKDRRGDY